MQSEKEKLWPIDAQTTDIFVLPNVRLKTHVEKAVSDSTAASCLIGCDKAHAERAFHGRMAEKQTHLM